MILLVGLYRDPDAHRMGEFLTCLERNVGNRLIEEIHVFVEEDVDPAQFVAAYAQLRSAKVRLIVTGERVTYRALFSYANRDLPGRRVIVANADIFFDDTLARLEDYDLANCLLCLSRWDVHADGTATLFDFDASQDAWIFQAPIRDLACDFPLGILGCDNRLAWEAEHAGLIVANPSRSVRAHHLHLTGIRRYTASDRLNGPVRGVPPLDLETAGIPRRAGRRAPGEGPTVHRETMYALTSLSPASHQVPAQRAALQSWAAAGLEIRSFNHPAEIETLRPLYDVEFVPSPRTTAHLFGRHCVPIKNMLEWIEGSDDPVMIINSDIQLRLAHWELQRLRWASHGGLCYFVRHNHDGDVRRATREAHGIDAFLFSARDAAMFPDSVMSMGQPFWDFWLPHVFTSAGRPISAVEFPAAFHQRHPMHWSWEAWRDCAIEFARVTDTPLDSDSFEGCLAMAARVRQSFDRHRASLSPGPRPIREWVETTFSRPGPKTFLELGAHCGTDTVWLSGVPGVSLHAFEPDPRNHPPELPNVTMHRAAIAEADGAGDLLLSEQGWGRPWTYSSSLKRPKNHLLRYPVTFGAAVRVDTVALDSVARQTGMETIDFIWADVQGAEGDMVRGGLQALSRTRYLYTAYSDDESYEGQATLRDLLALLPEFRVIDLWPDEVLLENRRMA